jgi:hypothetical protein
MNQAAVTLRLTSSRLLFDPPKGFLMLEIVRERDGWSVALSHESGREADLEFELQGFQVLPERTTDVESTKAKHEAGRFPDAAMQLPSFETVDLAHPPAAYKVTPAGLGSGIRFDAGEVYRVTLFGEVFTQALVKAE